MFLDRAEEAAHAHTYLAQRRRSVLGPDHPDTIDAEENLATAQRASYWPTYAARLRVQGPTHVDTLHTLERLLLAGLRAGDDPPATTGPTMFEPVTRGVTNVRLDGEHAEWLADLVALAVRFEDQEEVHGPDDPRALRAKIVLTHALAAADQFDGQIEDALAIVIDSREGLEEAAARPPETIEPHDLPIAVTIQQWDSHTRRAWEPMLTCPLNWSRDGRVRDPSPNRVGGAELMHDQALGLNHCAPPNRAGSPNCALVNRVSGRTAPTRRCGLRHRPLSARAGHDGLLGRWNWWLPP